MPIYELICDECGEEVEFKDSMNSDERKKQKCPKCGKEFMRQKFSGGTKVPCPLPRFNKIKDE